MQRRNGFTLVEMLIVAAIIGVVVAIAIPNLLNAIHRARQKRTMGDMRVIATAIEAYGIDYKYYPPSAAGTIPVIHGGLPYPTETLGHSLSTYITPSYLRAIPLVDGWNSWFLYISASDDYGIVSCARDNVCIQPTISGPTTDFNADIIFSDGHFTVYPDGAPQQ